MPVKGAEDGDVTLVEDLKIEVQALKTRCEGLEKAIKEMRSMRDTHERTLEAFRQQILEVQRHQGTLDLTYEGEVFEAMQ